mmetsp:Transcript_24386/g.64349  ORF Transcript_24386/g.64349 Transcript_24386/m.64349 type:complete len:91 (-) Transcript_24386:1101-1373(-)
MLQGQASLGAGRGAYSPHCSHARRAREQRSGPCSRARAGGAQRGDAQLALAPATSSTDSAAPSSLARASLPGAAPQAPADGASRLEVSSR